jgi:hypothetical protein
MREALPAMQPPRSRAFSHTSLTVPGCQLQGQKRNIKDTLFSGERLSSTLTLKKSLFGYFASLPAREIAIRHVLKRAQCHFRSGQSRTSQEEGRGRRPNEKQSLGRWVAIFAGPRIQVICTSAHLPRHFQLSGIRLRVFSFRHLQGQGYKRRSTTCSPSGLSSSTRHYRARRFLTPNEVQ